MLSDHWIVNLYCEQISSCAPVEISLRVGASDCPNVTDHNNKNTYESINVHIKNIKFLASLFDDFFEIGKDVARNWNIRSNLSNNKRCTRERNGFRFERICIVIESSHLRNTNMSCKYTMDNRQCSQFFFYCFIPREKITKKKYNTFLWFLKCLNNILL